MSLPFSLGPNRTARPRWQESPLTSSPGTDTLGALLGQTTLEPQNREYELVLNPFDAVEEAIAAALGAEQPLTPTGPGTLNFGPPRESVGDGHNVAVRGGTAKSTGKGGKANICGGNAAGSGDGGDLVLDGGNPAGGGNPGKVLIKSKGSPSSGGGGIGGASSIVADFTEKEPDGDILHSAGGTKHIIGIWQLTNIPAGRVAALIPLLGQTDNEEVCACYPGSVMGITIALNAPLTVGTLTIRPVIDGGPVAAGILDVVVDAAANTDRGAAAVGKDSAGAAFVPGSFLGIELESAGGMSPAGSIDGVVVMWVED